MIITPTSLTITQLLSSRNEQYVVPPYQRRYSWHEKQLKELIDDLTLLEDTDTHLLGSIVCLTGHHMAGINKLELVDGQQRITTISILLQCILDRLKRDGEQSEAQDIEQLLQARPLGSAPVRKIALDSLDADEFDALAAGKKIDQPVNPNLAFAFAEFRKWAEAQTIAELKKFLYRLTTQAIVIRLDVGAAKDAFKLFETINNRGLKLSPTDIIKNFILGNAARFNPPQLELARSRWAELIRHLDGTNSDSFFRHFLSAHLKTRITKSYVISTFKSVFMGEVLEAKQLPDLHWYEDDELPDDEIDDDVQENGEEPEIGASEESSRISFGQFLDHLVSSAKYYAQIVLGRSGKPEIDRHLRNLRLIKSIQSHGFLTALRVGGCKDEDFITILRLTETFLLRRHVCKERTSETDWLFARLSGVECSNPLPQVQSAYRNMSPPDERFHEAFAEADFDRALLDRARYCLEQFEMDQQGEHLELLVGDANLVHVEHIIPQKIKTRRARDEFGDWPEYLGANAEAKHRKFVSRIGNLTLFAGPLNIGASNNPYKRKKDAYVKSAIKITNSLPKDYKEFRFAQVEKRSAALADRAVRLWPIP